MPAPGTVVNAAEANRQALLAVIETAFGEAPPTPTLDTFRYTSDSLGQDTDTTESAEIEATRNVTDIIRTAGRVTGDVNFEFSYAAYDEWLRTMLFAAAWSAPVVEQTTTGTIESIATSPTTNARITGTAGDFTNIAVNDWVRIAGTPALSGDGNEGAIRKVVAKAGDSSNIELSGGDLVDEGAGALTIDVTAGAYIVNGVTPTTWTLEKGSGDVSLFEVLCGMNISGGSLNTGVGSIVNGSFSWLGALAERAVSTIASATNPATTNRVMNAIDHVEAIIHGGASDVASQFNMTWANNLRERSILGQFAAAGIGAGRFQSSGTLQTFLEDNDLLNEYLAFAQTSLALVFVGDGGAYVFDNPAVKFTAGRAVASGVDTDIIADLAWTAFRHPTELITTKIVRFPIA